MKGPSIFRSAAQVRQGLSRSGLVVAAAVLWFGLSGAFTSLAASAAEESPAGTMPATEEGLAPPAAQIAVDIFAIRDWQPPPPLAPVDASPQPPSPPPKPEAPPLPFRFLGKIAEPGMDTAFMLVHGDRVISIRVGESIGTTYLVEKVVENRLYFIYKPLKVRQSIFVGHPS